MLRWRVDGLTVSPLDSGSIDPKWSQTGVAASCSQARHITLAMSRSSQECKWYWPISEGNLTIAWGHLQWTSIPSKGRDITPRHVMSQKLELSTCTDELFGFSDPLRMELTCLPSSQ